MVYLYSFVINDLFFFIKYIINKVTKKFLEQICELKFDFFSKRNSSQEINESREWKKCQLRTKKAL